MMKLISFQHKSVLDKLNRDGIYECSTLSKFHESTPKCYNELSKRLNLRENISPVFAWYNVNGLPLEINSDSIGRALEMTGCDTTKYYLFELNVPDEYVDLQYFYNFVDMRCVEEFDDNVCITWYNVFNVDRNDNDNEIQATLPFIKREWIKNIYEVTYEQITKEFDSSILNMDYCKEHNLQIPKTAVSWEVTNINKLNCISKKMELF